MGSTGREINITISVGSAENWTPLVHSNYTAHVGPGSGAFLLSEVNSTSSLGPDDVTLYLPDGNWEIVAAFKGWGGTVRIHHRIQVGDGR